MSMAVKDLGRFGGKMLINKERELIVWQPLKNYSTSLNKYLCSYRVFGKERFKFVQGPVPYLPNDVLNPENEPSLGHTNWYPKRAINFKKLLPIRNPYDRAISQWKFTISKGENVSFNKWLMVHSKQLIKFPVTKLYEYDELIKVENIEQELKRFDLFKEECPFPHLNESWKSADSKNYGVDFSSFKLSQQQKDLIYYLHHEDFVKGEYEK